MAALLTHFQLTPAHVAALDEARHRQVVGFLLRWEAYGEALACLEARLANGGPVSPSQAAAAHLGLGQVDAARQILAAGMGAAATLPQRIEWTRLLLQAGEHLAAETQARALAAGADAISPAWSLLGEVELAAGNLEDAEALYLQLAKAAPGGHGAQLGLMQVQWRRGNLVAAAAYALRALELGEQGTDLSVAELSAVRAFFVAADDANRVRELNRRLVTRFDREVAALQAALATTTGAGVGAAPRLAPLPPPPAPAASPTVVVSPHEAAALQEAARALFGYPQLRPNQAEVLTCVQRGEHVLAVLPTGAGKSLCYQLPAFQGRGVTLVVAPLIALMKDQIDGLPPALRRQAVAVNSSLDGDDLRRTVERIAAGHYRLVYVAPERLRQLPFLAALQGAGVARLVIDEAHCVSIWGHDFRPDYLQLAQAHRHLGSPPILAMTATAPPRVRQDIEQQLLGRTGAMRVLVADTFRPNLVLTARRVRDDDERQQVCIDSVRLLSGSTQGGGIVYVRSRQRCEEVAAALRAAGIDAAHYHAGIPDRAAVQDRFMRGALPVIVATVAFGMGVDKPDIRFIVHDGLPASLEGYYQEIGRAGRDGVLAHCLLLYTDSDRATLSRLAAHGVLTAEQARAVYQALRGALGSAATGCVALAALAKQSGADEGTTRVALSLLEQAGVLQRLYDVPDHVTVQRLPGRRLRPGDPACDEFFRRSGLHTSSVAGGSFAELAPVTGIPLTELEGRLLAWQAEGRLRYQPQGRLLLLTLPAAPANAAQRVASLLSQRAVIAQQRVKEIADFAQGDGCRHAYLAHYLGGQEVRPAAGRTRGRRCGACDNCGAGLAQTPASAATERAVAHVLAALAEQSWGRRTLVRLLRGDPAAPARAHESRCYGALRDRSEQSISQLIDSLLGEQLLAARELDHGGVTLELTSKGRRRGR